MQELHDNSCTAHRPNGVDITIEDYTPESIDSNMLAMYGIVLIKEEVFDIVFNTADLAAWSPALPQEGDSFTIDSKTYKVFPIGEELYKYTTTSKKRIRVHLKG
jgi:hypothetical protein